MCDLFKSKLPDHSPLKQAAAFLNISPENLKRLIHRGEIRAGKMADGWVIKISELKRFKRKNQRRLAEIRLAEIRRERRQRKSQN
jgi:excisionase family DNA binding protein